MGDIPKNSQNKSPSTMTSNRKFSIIRGHKSTKFKSDEEKKAPVVDNSTSEYLKQSRRFPGSPNYATKTRSVSSKNIDAEKLRGLIRDEITDDKLLKAALQNKSPSSAVATAPMLPNDSPRTPKDSNIYVEDYFEGSKSPGILSGCGYKILRWLKILFLLFLISGLLIGVGTFIVNIEKSRFDPLSATTTNQLDNFIANQDLLLASSNESLNHKCGRCTIPKKGLCAPILKALPISHKQESKKDASECITDLNQYLCDSFTSDPLNTNRSLVYSYLNDYQNNWLKHIVNRENLVDDFLTRAYSLCIKGRNIISSIHLRLLQELDRVQDYTNLSRIFGMWSAAEIPSIFDVILCSDPRSVTSGITTPVLAFVPQRKFFEESSKIIKDLKISSSEIKDFNTVIKYLKSLYFESIPNNYRSRVSDNDFVSYVIGSNESSSSWSNLSRDLMPLLRFSESLSVDSIDLQAYFSGLTSGFNLILDPNRLDLTLEEITSENSRILVWVYRHDFFSNLKLTKIPINTWKKYLEITIMMEKYKKRSSENIKQQLSGFPEDYLPAYTYNDINEQKNPDTINQNCLSEISEEFYILVTFKMSQELEAPGYIFDKKAMAYRYLMKFYDDISNKYIQLIRESKKLSRTLKTHFTNKITAITPLIGSSLAHTEIVRILTSPKTFAYNTFLDLVFSLRAARRYYEVDFRYRHLESEDQAERIDALIQPLADNNAQPDIIYYPAFNAIVVHPMMVSLLFYPADANFQKSSTFLLETSSRIGWYFARAFAHSLDKYSTNFDKLGKVKQNSSLKLQDATLYDSMYTLFNTDIVNNSSNTTHSKEIKITASECISQRLAFCVIYTLLSEHEAKQDVLLRMEWLKQMFSNTLLVECGNIAPSINWCVKDFKLFDWAFNCSPKKSLDFFGNNTESNCLDSAVFIIN